jgi:hypothetical protein
MSGWTKVFLTIAGFALAMPVAAQAPTPTTKAAMEWPEVDCRAAKLTTTASPTRCQRGPVFNDVGGSEHYGFEDCAGEQWAVFTRSPANFGFARLANMRALVPSCSTRLGFGDIAAKLKTPMRGVCDRSEPSCVWANDTTGWSEVSQIGDIYAASFTSARGENCKAFVKFGPPWGRGFAWGLRGWLCGAQGKSVSDGDLQTFVSSLIVKAQ